MRSTPLLSAVRRALDAAGLGRPGQALVAGLSGGPDSAALVEALASLRRERGFTLVAAHLDHGLRRAARADAAFCEELCARLSVPLELGREDVKARAARLKQGLEAAARAARHGFLRDVAAEHGAAAIALGHTLDDQAETLLLRLVRGAGGDGLAAMRPLAGDLFRPLLAVSRADVLHHLARRRLGFREDASNRDRRHERNRLRHDLLPRLERAFHGRVREHLAATADLLARDAEALDAWARRALAQARGNRGRGAGVQVEDGLSCEVLGRRPEAVASRVIRLWLADNGGLAGVGRVHVETLLALCRAGSGRFALPGAREAHVGRGRLRLQGNRAKGLPRMLGRSGGRPAAAEGK